ncbi:MAG: HAMP domain-containing histidine kinase [Bacteroidetes bacterium]|nr:HAMP domain-containing histidine kinase [Bacteroidota bacterium]
MKKLEFKRIGLLIGVTLLVTLAIQTWRIGTQWEILKSELQQDIQQGFDRAVENYYADLAKSDVFALTDYESKDSSASDTSFMRRAVASPLFKKTLKLERKTPTGEQNLVMETSSSFDSLNSPTELAIFSPDSMPRAGAKIIAIRAIKTTPKDSLRIQTIDISPAAETINRQQLDSIKVDQINKIQIFRGKDAVDSLNAIERFTSKIIFSIIRDTLDLPKLTKHLDTEFERSGIALDYRLHFADLNSDSLARDSIAKEIVLPYNVGSSSSFLPAGKSLDLYYDTSYLTLFKRGFVEVLSSLLFLGILAFAFYYLYQTIKNQKEIAEIKQDLIANITHEFKTPIATTLTAIEGIQQFNPTKDPEKTDRYLDISKVQLRKLDQMVEKLLETAALDSDQLVLKKESFDPAPVLTQLVQKFQTLDPEKEFTLLLPPACSAIEADPFHFEQVISNLIDNAVKYGGARIQLALEQVQGHQIRVEDNGGSLRPEQEKLIFDQFYRIPKGNLHDVKGFGIGLYYVKKIMEKHGGRVALHSNSQSTCFTTYWP